MLMLTDALCAGAEVRRSVVWLVVWRS